MNIKLIAIFVALLFLNASFSHAMQCTDILENKVLKSHYRHGEIFRVPFDQVFMSGFSGGSSNQYIVIYKSPNGRSFEMYEVINPEALKEDKDVLVKLNLSTSQVQFEGYTKVVNGKVMFHYRGVVYYY